MFKILLKFPRFYSSLKLFGRVFSFDIGWFWADSGSDWSFGPEFTVQKVAEEASVWTAYYCNLGFLAFRHEFLISVGTSDID